MSKHGTIHQGTLCPSTAQFAQARPGSPRHASVRHVLARHVLPRHGTARHAAARFAQARHAESWHGPFCQISARGILTWHAGTARHGSSLLLVFMRVEAHGCAILTSGNKVNAKINTWTAWVPFWENLGKESCDWRAEDLPGFGMASQVRNPIQRGLLPNIHIGARNVLQDVPACLQGQICKRLARRSLR